MRVKFHFTVDDLVNAQLRILKRSAAARSWRVQDLVLTSIVTGVFLFAIIPGEILERSIVGAIGLLLGALLYPLINELTLKRRLRQLFEESAGEDKLFLCEVELKDSGIYIKQGEGQISYSWDNVKEIRETKDSVDIYTQKLGGVIVRSRAFTSSDEQQQFIELANRYWKLGREASDANGEA